MTLTLDHKLTLRDLSPEARELVDTDWDHDDPQHAEWRIIHPYERSDPKDDKSPRKIVASGHGHDDFVRLGMPHICEQLAHDARTRAEREANAAKEAEERAAFEAWKRQRDDPDYAAREAAKAREQADFAAFLSQRGGSPS